MLCSCESIKNLLAALLVVTTSKALVTTSKALVTTSDALVTSLIGCTLREAVFFSGLGDPEVYPRNDGVLFLLVVVDYHC